MANGDIKILDKLYINQNLICLIVSFIFIERSRHWCCCGDYTLIYWLFYVFFAISLTSIIISIVAYTLEYCRKKTYMAKEHKLNYKNQEKGDNKKIVFCSRCPLKEEI